MPVTIDGTSGVNTPSLTTSGSTVPVNGLYLPTTNTLGLATNSVERVRIDASGNLGIGTTSPAQALHVISTGNQIKYPLRLQNDGTSGITLGVGVQLNVYNGTSVANIGTIIGTGSTWSYGTYSANQVSISGVGSGGVRVATASAPITFHTGNADSDLSTERMRINAGAPILCLSGGNTSATGTGIAFPATQSASTDANTLDDYEEGTFTAGIAFGGASVGVTYDLTPTCAYTKIGRQVSITGRVGLSNKGSSTGAVAITGLPFTPANTGNAGYGAISISLGNGTTFTNVIMGIVVPNSSVLTLTQVTNAGVQSNMTDTNFTNSSNIIFSLFYFV